MKIAASKLRQIIREEAQRLAEADSLKPGDYALGAYFSVEKMGKFEKAMLDLFNDALRSASNDLGDPKDAHDTHETEHTEQGRQTPELLPLGARYPNSGEEA